MILLLLVYLLVDNKPIPSGFRTISPIAVFWKLLVPVLPIVFLTAPGPWRNICPLAFLNVVAYKMTVSAGFHQRFSDRLRHSSNAVRLWFSRSGFVLAMVLFFIIVPSRLFLFNLDPHALVALLLIFMVSAFVGGLVLPYKAGWCSSVCPLYPLENAYGMSPICRTVNTHCYEPADCRGPKTWCSGCARSCLDLKIMRPANIHDVRQSHWKPSPHLRFFISIFPGFVLAYFLLDKFQVAITTPSSIAKPVIFGCCAAAALTSMGIYRLLELAFVKRNTTDMITSAKRLDAMFVIVAMNTYYFMVIPPAVAAIAALSGWKIASAWHSPVEWLVLFVVVLASVNWLYRAWQPAID